jgi:hypothetical protein
MLGHSSATMTMDTYGHLFENRLDEVADAMDAARSAARAARESALETAQAVAPAGSGVAQVLPKADLIDLAEVRSKGKTAGQRAVPRGAPGRIRTYATASGEPEDDN